MTFYSIKNCFHVEINFNLVLMKSCIDADMPCSNCSGIGELELFISIFLTLILMSFDFVCLSFHSNIPIFFLGAFIHLVNNIERSADLFLRFPDGIT